MGRKLSENEKKEHKELMHGDEEEFGTATPFQVAIEKGAFPKMPS